VAKTIVFVMAGGRGSRLSPLTIHRAKPAVPFGGRYRIIDFVLSNFVNSGYRQIYVLTQFMASSLIRHLQRNWQLSSIDGFIEIAPAQMRLGDHWYRGTADSVAQNLNLIFDARADVVAVFGGDHVYKFDISQMEAEHRESDADLTIAALPVPLDEARAFGVIQIDGTGRITGFQEKPDNPTPMPGRPDHALVSMGNYLFRTEALREALLHDEPDATSSHDFGKDVIPRLLKNGALLRVYDFGTNRIPGEPEQSVPYWRDVGDLDSYIAANMDVRSRVPSLNLYNRNWRIRTAQRDYPPARFVQEPMTPASTILDSLICEGCVISSARVDTTMLGYDCFVHTGAAVSESVILSGCNVGAGAKLHRVMLDKNCSIAPGAEVGLDPEKDAERFPFITPNGFVALPKGTVVPKEGPIELANDIAYLLERDAVVGPTFKEWRERLAIGDRRRHSFTSAGPRYRKYKR